MHRLCGGKQYQFYLVMVASVMVALILMLRYLNNQLSTTDYYTSAIRGVDGAELNSFNLARQYLEDRNVKFVKGVPLVIWTFYHGAMGETRLNCLLSIANLCGMVGFTHIHLNLNTIPTIKVSPWHHIFEESITPNDEGLPSLLSANHISDYLRVYLLYYYGGWWSDVKKIKKSVDLIELTNQFADSDARYASHHETEGHLYGDMTDWAFENFGIFKEHIEREWKSGKVTNPGMAVSKPENRVTKVVNELNDNYLDLKEAELRLHPAPKWKCCRPWEGDDYPYPIDWTNLLGGPLCSAAIVYHDNILIFDGEYPHEDEYGRDE